MTPLLSVLLPSRSRLSKRDNVLRLVESCYRFAANPDSLEIIVRLDYDDELALSRISALEKFQDVRVIVGKRFSGYSNLHIFANECARLATGRWLGFFNDDAWVDSQGWDVALEKFAQPLGENPMQVCFAKVDFPCDHFSDEYVKNFVLGPRYDFPIVSRRLYEAAGLWCPSPVLDWWWHRAFHALPQLGGAFVDGLLLQHDYERSDRLKCCDDEPAAIAYRTPHFENEMVQTLARISKAI
jgi:hypothetical protein